MPVRPTTPRRCRWRHGCGLELIPLTRGADPADLEPGTAFHGGRGLCRTHHRYAKDQGELDLYPRLTHPMDEVLARWREMTDAGHSLGDVAESLGLTKSAVRFALVRAGVRTSTPRRAPVPGSTPRRRPSTGWSRPQYFDPDTRDEGED